MDTAELVVFEHLISVLILSFGSKCVTSSRDLAAHTNATQSSTFEGNVAGKAVDGVLGRNVVKDGHCSHTGLQQQQAWWKVDLGDRYRIQTINFTYRQDYTYRLSGYYLYVTNDTHMTQNLGRINSTLGQLCYHDSGPGYPSFNQSRTCPVTGRYVIFYNIRPADYVPLYRYGYSTTEAYIELCEVQVFGCPVNYFGPDCDSECHCGMGGCNPDTGQCDVSGCQSGWMGTNCSETPPCETGLFGAHCDLACHCQFDGCNSITGICDKEGCEPGWKGPSCYTAANDLAFRKSTSQSSENDANKYDSFNATDGLPGEGSCSHTHPRAYTKAWWKVDLGKTYRINTIKLVFTQSHKSIIRGYQLYVSNVSSTDSFSQAHMCFHDETTSTDNLPSYITSHPCSVNGQYVIVYNNRSNYDTVDQGGDHMKYALIDAIVELCDVQVLGCQLNHFAADCNRTCHCKIGGCHSDTGVCDVPGCQDGWTAENCSVCVSNHYGSECRQKCHCMTKSCDMATGRCSQPGCQSGWKGDACDRMCDTNHFGPDCTKQCHCQTEGCNRINGTCNVTGCQDEWTGKACDQMCDTNHFGPDCTKQCHCMTHGCNRINGTCNVAGCQDGWSGTSCDQKCFSAHFGLQCSEVCHCQQEGCDHVNGICHHVGCQAGWSGRACDHQCGSNTFGRDCRDTCHCANSGCETVNGVCTILGCTEGWTGDSCSHVCVAGRFGKDCLQECHCKVEGCDNVDGMCNATGCVDGWRGTSCDHTCDFTHYGPNCLFECHCNISGCSNTNGLCQTPGCEDGWTGPSCSDAAEHKSSESDCPPIAEVSTCTTGYALLGTFLAISISFNIGLTIQRVRMRFSSSRTQQPPKELQTYHIPDLEDSYEGLDSTKIDKTRNIYDTIVK